MGQDHPFYVVWQDSVVSFEMVPKSLQGLLGSTLLGLCPKAANSQLIIGRELVWAMQIWQPFQESWKY